MRKVLALVASAAILAVTHVGSAGATGDLPQVPEGDEVCKTAFVPADVGLGVAVEKKITLAGVVLNANVKQEVIKVFKTIAVEVCVRTEGDVVADVDLDGALNGVAECPNGGHGADIHAPMKLKAGVAGGAVVASVKIAVHDEDAVAGVAFDDTDVVISEEKKVLVPPAMVEDTDAVDAHACVGPVAVG